MRKGFTLIELLVVMFIIFVFAALILPHFVEKMRDHQTIKPDKQMEETMKEEKKYL